MKNGKPSNLFPLLKAVNHPFGDNQKVYETSFCNGHQKQIGRSHAVVWDCSGSSNLKLLNAHIASHVFYKTKEDCLKDLPPSTRKYKRVPVCSRQKLRYLNAMKELVRVIVFSFFIHAIDSSLTKHEQVEHDCLQAKTMSAHRNSDSDALASTVSVLGPFNRVRTVAAFAKVDATVSLTKSLLENEPAIVIFTTFVDIAKDVHQKLTASGWSSEILTGES